MPKEMWHSFSADDALKRLDSSEKGLTQKEAKQRLEKEGKNELEKRKGKTSFDILADQFKDFLILLLIAAAFISVGIGVAEGSVQEMVEAGFILVIVVFIVVVGFYQEYSAEKELEALKSMMSPTAVVVRDGKESEIEATALVPGDVIQLEAGSRVPADARLLTSVDLAVDESSLTGESTPVRKKPDAVQEDTGLADRTNMLYMATNVVAGKASAVVVETGMDTELGAIAGHIASIKEEKTPLQKRLGVLGKQIGIAVIILCAIVFATGLIFSNQDPLHLFIIAVALAVAAVPEGLPGVVTVALATGTRRMVAKHVIIRKLPAVETLGSTTVICTDKTGTLTKNEMTVKQVWTPSREYAVAGEGYSAEGAFEAQGESISDVDTGLARLVDAASGANDAGFDGKDITGDPTEASLLVAAAKLDYEPAHTDKKRVDEIPFSSERKQHTVVYETEDEGFVAVSKGAPDVVLEKCERILIEGKVEDLTEQHKKDITDQNATYADDAYRVLAFAQKPLGNSYDKDADKDALEDGMVFLGLAAMIDPPREESAPSVEQCRKAGIRVVMITGDHALTAKAIAREIGIIGGDDARVVSGRELEDMDDDELAAIVDDVSVYARVSPTHKIKIVSALQKKDHIVAMTGDGVNDAPALKKADIGIAMGVTGTDVSKEAADMVLTDDNFASIVTAVNEGRGIYDNIKKFFAYLISGNIGEVAVVFLSSLIPGVPIALTANMILIINLVTDAFPALALGVDPFEPGAMERKPRPKDEPLHRGLARFIVWYPLLMIAVTMGLFLWVWDPAKQNVFEAQTVAFLTINVFESFQAFSARSIRYPSLKVGMFKNKWLVLAVVGSLVILPIFLYVPIPIPTTDVTLQEIAHFYPLSAELFWLVFGLSTVGFIYLELSKYRASRTDDAAP